MSDDEALVKKKVLIRSSADNAENLLCFPLLHALRNAFEGLEIDVLVDEGNFNVFKLLPFKVNCYEVPKKKSSFAGIHHFSYNLNEVFNVDYFFDLKGDFKGAFFGITFNAHERIGFATGFNKFFLTKKVEMKGRPHSDVDYLKLLATISDIEFTEKVAGVKIEKPLIPKIRLVEEGENEVSIPAPVKKNSYILVMADKLSLSAEQNKLWLDFFDCFIDEKFAIYFEKIEVEEDKLEKDTLLSFIGELDDRNKYIPIPDLTPETFKTIALEATTIVTNEKWAGLLGAYLGCKAYTFTSGGASFSLEHFAVSPELVLTRSSIPTKVLGSIENTAIDNMTDLVDIIQGLK
ncbi:MAG: hypothetical protein KAG61_00245 [Bacteriovoracaceae bacterium]|nr:hypothetical protein [Bacteriovoracaceae bacterium]